MARLTKKQKKEIGLAPDELYFRGEQRSKSVNLTVIDFDTENNVETTINSPIDAKDFEQKATVTWFNIDGLHDKKIMGEIASVFEFDPLILADVMDTQARPKIHDYKNCLAVSIKMLQHNAASNTITVENLSLVLTSSMLFSFQEIKGDVFEPVRERIRNEKRRIRKSGTDYLMFALMDIVVDNYIYIITILGEKIENLEDKLLTNPDKDVIENINSLKQELNFLRRNIKPAKEVILALSKSDSEFIKDENAVHFKELVDNINQAVEVSDSYREILSDQLNIYHTTISSKLNDIMKFLTVFSVIFIPLTFIAGIYGTNFEFVPELKFKYSYFIMWGVMIVVAILMLFYFKRKKWL